MLRVRQWISFIILLEIRHFFFTQSFPLAGKTSTLHNTNNGMTKSTKLAITITWAPTRIPMSLSSTTTANSIFTQVISDVDDTLKSSGGVNVAGVALGGIDVQYERGDFYPGVAEFMLEISRYGLSDVDATAPPKIAVLTARAEEFKVALEIKDSSKLAIALRTAGERLGISGWGVGPVLYGSVAEWVVQFRKGLRKFTNFERLLQQDPTGMIVQVRHFHYR